jgi:hypothetical protein
VHGVGERAHRDAVGDVDLVDDERAVTELGGQRVEPRLIDVASGDARAFPGGGETGRTTDAAAGTGDDDDVIAQVHAASGTGIDMHMVSTYQLLTRSQ